MSDWAKAELERRQALLMAPSLDEQIGADHGIRLLEAMLAEEDWGEWEAAYDRCGAGRPPLHPRLVAGAIIYGLLKGVRSTRGLEEASVMRLDFRWLLEGRRVDHSTYAEFRNRFGGQIEGLFKRMNRRAAEMRKATLEEVVIDGTRLRADSDRHGAHAAPVLEKKLAALEEQIGRGLSELAEDPGVEGTEGASRAELERRLALLDARRRKLARALEVARQRDGRKRAKDGEDACAVRVPVGDPDAHLMPNKEGGFAPNYTPVAAVDSATGLIVGAGVAEGNAEAESVPALMAQVRETAVEPPRRALFDGGFASGQNLRQLADEGVDAYAPLGAAKPGANPAERPDPGLPIAPDAIKDLPVRGGQLDRAAFVYDGAGDIYHCPMGQPMPPARTLTRQASGGTIVTVVEYRCNHCGGCPLAAACLSRGARARTISRDQYEPQREAVRARMRTGAGEATYSRRAPVAEGVFAHIKSAMGIRRFARRGMAKVTADWFWICTAFNLGKLIRAAGKTLAPPSSRPALTRIPKPWLDSLRAGTAFCLQSLFLSLRPAYCDLTQPRLRFAA